MARKIKEGIKVFLRDPADGDWSVRSLRHCDQTLRNEILAGFSTAKFLHVMNPDWDLIPIVVTKDLPENCDVYRMRVMGRDCYLVDPCDGVEAVIRRMNICTRIHDERIKQGITQEELYVLSGIPEKSISQIERGLWSPTLDVMIKLGSALGIELKYVEPNNDK